MEMTVELFDSIINTSQDCVFWKDINRRFLGVNQAFLDFYGFDSPDVLIGKTDEDMGWHSDPEPFRQDEERVLQGHSTYKVQGKCIIRGEERDIIASKRPLYDGDGIVGLVGSFVDITDVLRRKNGLGSTQVVYTLEKLRRFAFFDRIIDEISLEEILDPLTGVLSRAFSIKFVHALIAQQTPFSFTMFDLDNFKFFNDTYGHSAGDKVLTTVAKGLAEAVGENGLVGRFGGDELLMIDLKNIENPDKKAFFEELYSSGKALRRNVDFGMASAFVTGTAGSASFPKDAEDYGELFARIDKMLYLGKSRGRNCYTVYDENDHKDIEIRKIAKQGAYTEMHRLRHTVEETEGFEKRLKAVLPQLSETLQVPDLYYVREDGRMRAVLDPSFDADASDLPALMKDDLFAESGLESIEKNAPLFCRSLRENGFGSALVVTIRDMDRICGYLVCAVDHSHRIWQENECASLYYLAGLLA